MQDTYRMQSQMPVSGQNVVVWSVKEKSVLEYIKR